MPRKSSKETPVVLSEVVYTNDEHTGIRVGSPAWWDWLTDQKRFYYQADTPFTARQEKRRNGMFWYAYRKHQGKLYKVYLGTSNQLTGERLAQVACQLADKIAQTN
jgi:LuxR family maltose regulon positive regulatory protein